MSVNTEMWVTQALADLCGTDFDDIDRGQSLANDLDLSPEEIVQISGDIDREFNVQLTNDDIDTLDTVGDLISFIQKNRS